MKMSVVGTGYVGLVAGACFADSGNHVICVDCDQGKIQRLSNGEIPIYEPGLAEIVARNSRAGRLEFTTDLEHAVQHSLIIFLAVGTPSRADGAADLSAILDVAGTIGKTMDGYRIIVMKSTVPVGTCKRVSAAIAQETGHPFDYVSNPEFLKEGAAVEDFTKPDRIVIGATNPAVVEIMKEVYAPLMRRDERMFVMDPASAEMTKYAANAMLAVRISFMNELAALCDEFGADIESVRRGVGSDSRIGSAFLYAGIGYGGSCFPKDITALVSMGQHAERPMSIAAAVHEVNQRQRRLFADRVLEHFGDRCDKTTLAVWGLSFKSRTDDVRESPAIACIRAFLDRGMRIRAHDPEALRTAARALGETVELFDDGYEALAGADALAIFTDWPKFRTPDFDLMAERMRNKIIFDGRNLYDPKAMARRGFRYFSVGRPSLPPG